MEDKISIVVPVYNMEQHLERCVNSLIKQTYSNLEILLIDDGSKDKSLQLCHEFARMDYRIKKMAVCLILEISELTKLLAII